MQNGFIKIYRQMTEWEWYRDTVTKSVFLHLLLTASWKPMRYKGKEYPAGTVITTTERLSEELGFSAKQIRRALANLQKTGELGNHRGSHEAIYIISNYAVFQGFENENFSKNAETGQSQGNHRAITLYKKNVRSKELRSNTARTREEPSFNISKFNEYVDSVDLKYRKEVAE